MKTEYFPSKFKFPMDAGVFTDAEIKQVIQDFLPEIVNLQTFFVNACQFYMASKTRDLVYHLKDRLKT